MSRFLDFSITVAILLSNAFFDFFSNASEEFYFDNNLDLEMFVTKKNCIITASVNFPHSEYST